jgi:ABC-type dipeptide/oligopeptide/nickel transport system ATPase component
MSALLSVENLHVEFATYGGIVQAVRGVSFSVNAGETLAIVGESGCGKSVSMQAVMGLIPMPPGRIRQGSANGGIPYSGEQDDYEGDWGDF